MKNNKENNNGMDRNYSDDLGRNIRRYAAKESGRVNADKRKIETGFKDLDRIIGGLPKGALTTVGSHPGVGKTSLALNIARNVSLGLNGDGRKHPVMYFSLEMPATSLSQRLAAIDKKLFGASEKILANSLVIDDEAAIDVGAIRERVRMMVGEKGVELVVVDSLQLCRCNASACQVREIETGEIVKQLKAMAKELDVAVVVLVRLSRTNLARKLSADFSGAGDCGSVVEMSDLAMIVHRYNSNSDRRIEVVKNVNGDAGTCWLDCDNATMAFSDSASHRRMKDDLNTDLQYNFGFPMGRYGECLTEFARTKVNSHRTSSILVAEYWQPSFLKTNDGILASYLPGIHTEDSLKYFEFPTEAKYNGRIVGRPSMTDLMIWDDTWQVAIEGKYTEYVWGPSQTHAEWMSEKTAGVEIFLRRTVTKAWLDYIRKAHCTDLEDAEFFNECGDVCYQFLHRTASACFMTNDSSGKKPVLVYQLFYNKYDEEHVAKLEAFKNDLRTWAAMLRLKNMKFLIVSVPVTNADEVEDRFGGLRGEIFERMKLETIYEFDFDNIEVEEVIKGGL